MWGRTFRSCDLLFEAILEYLLDLCGEGVPLASSWLELFLIPHVHPACLATPKNVENTLGSVLPEPALHRRSS